MRVPFVPDTIGLTIVDAHGSSQTVEACGLNISRGGVALMVVHPVETAVACRVALPTLEGTTRTATGKTRGCLQIRGEYYELGITLDQHIDLAEFVRLSPDQRLVYHREQSEAAATADQATDDEPAMFSQALDQASLRPLICEYLRELQVCIDRLHAAADAGDCTTLSRIVQWVHGSADAFGFPALADAAEAYQAELAHLATAELHDIKSTARSFTGLLQRACRSAG